MAMRYLSGVHIEIILNLYMNFRIGIFVCDRQVMQQVSGRDTGMPDKCTLTCA